MSDYIIRGTAANGQIRAFAATTREMAETAREKHNTSPVASAALGRLMTAGAIMGSMMKGDADLMTLQVKGDGPIKGVTVTADSKGNAKGYVGDPMVMLPPNKKGKLDVGGAVGAGYLSVIKDLGLKEPYVGQVELQTGEIADDLTYYFAVSEQTPSVVGLGVLMEKTNHVKQSGGFIIQLMPDATEEVIEQLEAKIAGVDSVTKLLDAGKTPEMILEQLLGDMDLEILDKMDTRFYCNCSKERVAKALISIGKESLQEIIDDGKPVELNCHFCNTSYEFALDEVKELYELSK